MPKYPQLAGIQMLAKILKTKNNDELTTNNIYQFHNFGIL